MSTSNQYGQTFEQVNQVSRPVESKHPWGTMLVCIERPEFAFGRLRIAAGACIPLHFYRLSLMTYLVEEGEITTRLLRPDAVLEPMCLRQRQVLHVPAGCSHSFFASQPSTLYFFTTPGFAGDRHLLEDTGAAQSAFSALASKGGSLREGKPTVDFRDKYWGSIETVRSDDIAGKRIFLRKGGQSSLEYHVFKTEAYYVHSGSICVGLRVGRGENKMIMLAPGDAFTILPGTMHMRIALEDSLVIEASTRDDDADSHLVEDGMKYKHLVPN
ncbi:MAG TPA: hypothetical protein VL200_15275 [Lacunisphaera sp.]|jgi:mannose-6-phosphate isomerase-like protein (cupin superfamily)|nr:hypothetical protein [Lacunisphaera sp.]